MESKKDTSDRVKYWVQKFERSTTATILAGTMTAVAASANFKITDKYEHLYIFIFVICALFLYVYFKFRDRIRNMGIFLGTLFCLVALFPTFHILLYKSDVKNYSYGNELLKIVSEELKVDEETNQQSLLLSEIFLNTEKPILNSKISPYYLTKSKKYIFSQQLAALAGESPFGQKISVYQASGKYLLSFPKLSEGMTLKEAMVKQIMDYRKEISKANSPEFNIYSEDFWMYSVFIFKIGDIRPLKSLPNLLSGIQILFAGLLTILIGSMMGEGKYFGKSKSITSTAPSEPTAP